MKRSSCLIVLLVLCQCVYAHPVISEFSAAGTNLKDIDSSEPDWIEIYNPMAAPVDLLGWALTDDETELDKWVFPSVIIEAGGYLVVFASGKDRVDGELHTNFKLSKQGEYLALVMPDGVTLATEFAPAYLPQSDNLSYGLSGSAIELSDQATAVTYTLATAPNNWVDLSFDDRQWQEGNLGIGYDRGGDYALDLQTEVPDGTTDVYIRMPFELPDVAALDNLALTTRVDDGFRAWLNGVVVDQVNYQSPNAGEAEADRTIDLSAHRDFLVNGTNVLAVHVKNASASSSDLLFTGKLTTTDMSAAYQYQATPTPGQSNSGDSYTGFVEDVAFAVGRGHYETPLTETITATQPGAVLAYTEDGSEPTLANGTLIDPLDETAVPSTEVTVFETTVIRARAFMAGYRPSAIAAHTYIFPIDVLQQSDMDADVLASRRGSNSFAPGLLAASTLSISLNPSALFGSNGIYTKPRNTGILWERPASIEYMDPNNNDAFSIYAGLRIHGADSRNHAKKAFGLFFRRQYGNGKLHFPLFDNSPVTAFDKLIIRSGGHDAWTSPWGEQADSATYLRDEFLRQTHADMGHPATLGKFVHLYLNGRYWGVYNIVQRVDEDFGAGHFGGEDTDWDVIQGQSSGEFVISGSDADWRSMMAIAEGGLTSDEAYAQLQDYVDIDNLIDFMIVRIWGSDMDWLKSRQEPSTGNRNKNWFAMRNRTTGGRFIFFVYDGEISMGKDHRANRRLDTNLTDVGIANSPGRLYTRLRENAHFRQRFAERLQIHFHNNGALAVQNNVQRWQGLVDHLDDLMILESARWGDAVNHPPFTRDNHWRSEVDWIRDVFLVQRGSIVLDQCREIGLYP